MGIGREGGVGGDGDSGSGGDGDGDGEGVLEWRRWEGRE